MLQNLNKIIKLKKLLNTDTLYIITKINFNYDIEKREKQTKGWDTLA